MSEQNVTQELLSTYVVIDNQAHYPIAVELKAGGDIAEALELLREGYLVKHKDNVQHKLIIAGMFDALLAEAPHLNLNYDRSIKLGTVTLYYGKTSRLAPVTTKDLSKYFEEPVKTDTVVSDELDLSGLADIDFDAVNQRVEQMQAGGGEVVAESNECEGGGCKI